MIAQRENVALKREIRGFLDSKPLQDKLHRRAVLLLQSAQFLDIDKVIEYRPEDPQRSIGKRPAVPQLTVKGMNHQTGMPTFASLSCAECHSEIQGSCFRTAPQNPPTPEFFICETCYRRLYYYGNSHFEKMYKHCCLHSCITPEISRKICECANVSRINSLGQSRALFPVSASDQHLGARSISTPLRCGLYQLSKNVAEAKYASTSTAVNHHPALQEAI